MGTCACPDYHYFYRYNGLATGRLYLASCRSGWVYALWERGNVQTATPTISRCGLSGSTPFRRTSLSDTFRPIGQRSRPSASPIKSNNECRVCVLFGRMASLLRLLFPPQYYTRWGTTRGATRGIPNNAGQVEDWRPFFELDGDHAYHILDWRFRRFRRGTATRARARKRTTRNRQQTMASLGRHRFLIVLAAFYSRSTLWSIDSRNPQQQRLRVSRIIHIFSLDWILG